MTLLDAPPIPDLPIYKLSVKKYHELIRSGVLDHDDRIELLNGWMVPKLSNNPPHAGVKELTVEVLRNLVPARYSVRSEKPITLGESEPEPDVTVVAGTPRDYFDRHPGPEDIALVIEVSDASLNRDRKTKKQIYAKAGILCYWIVDVTSRKVEVYSRPADSAYLSCEEFTAQVPLCIGDQPAVMIEIASLLP